MTRSMLRFVVALALTVFLTSLAHAEVLEIEGMVKAVDSDDRTITIERKTPKGTKTLELEVTKKAGDLGSVKPGDSISFSYDPDLELVTKIAASVNERLAPWQGEWIAIDGYAEGQRLTRDDLSKLNRRIIVEGNALTSERTKAGVVDGAKGEITVDESGGVFSFDGVKVSDSRSVGWRGRFRLEKDLLTLAYKDANLLNGEPPPDFATDSVPTDKRFNQYTFKRIATKPGAGNGKAEQKKEMCRVTFSISETGDCRLRLEKTMPSTGKTERVKQPDGTWVCKHYFASPSDIELFENPFGPVVNVRVDKDQKQLLFEAAPAKGFDRKASQITYPTRLRVPFEVSLDLAASGKDFMFQINPMPTQLGQRQAIVNIKSDDALRSMATVSVANMTRDAQGKPTFDAPLLEEQRISFEKPWEKKFRLPVPNIRSRDAYNVRLGVIGDSGVSASSLTVSGIPLPLLGMKLGERDGVVFAETIQPNSLAEKAALQSGDVLVEVRGKTPTSGNEAVELLADMPFDEASEIIIQRGDRRKTVRITPTFGK